MTRRAVLIAQWRDRLTQIRKELAASERQDRVGARDWVRRAYARVLTYMLAQYGDAAAGHVGNASSESGDEPPPPTASAWVGLEHATLHGAATPPKSADRIRSTLAGVHAQVADVPAGPLQSGSPANIRIVAGAYRSHRAAELVCQFLMAHGISARVDAYGDRWKVEIPDQERDAAFKLLAAADMSLVDQEEQKSLDWTPAYIRFYIVFLVVAGIVAAVLVLRRGR